MQVVIILKETDGKKEAIGASRTKTKAEEYLNRKSVDKYSTELVDIPSNNLDNIDYIYQAFKPTNRNTPPILVGYFTNRFNAQQASQPGGYIRRIPYFEKSGWSGQDTQKFSSGHLKTSASQVLKTDKQPSSANTSKNKPQSNLPKRRNNVPLLIVLIVTWLVVMVVISRSNKSSFRLGENVNSVEFLPDYCSDISFFINERFRVYEFPCDPAKFKQYTAELELTVIELTSPKRARTYRQYAEIDWIPPKELNEDQQWQAWKDLSQPTVESGFEIIGRANFNGTVSGLYDSTSQRVYYWEKELNDKDAIVQTANRPESNVSTP